MQSSEIQQGFQRAQQCIRQAAQACQSENTLSMDLKDSIQQLDQQADRAGQMMQSGDDESIRQCVNDLEQLGDRARDACRVDSGASAEIKDAVTRAHDELSSLKKQFH